MEFPKLKEKSIKTSEDYFKKCEKIWKFLPIPEDIFGRMQQYYVC